MKLKNFLLRVVSGSSHVLMWLSLVVIFYEQPMTAYAENYLTLYKVYMTVMAIFLSLALAVISLMMTDRKYKKLEEVIKNYRKTYPEKPTLYNHFTTVFGFSNVVVGILAAVFLDQYYILLILSILYLLLSSVRNSIEEKEKQLIILGQL